MTMIELKCPDCGATMDVEEGREFIFCQYCGRKIYLADVGTELRRYELKRIYDNKDRETEEKYEIRRKRLNAIQLVVLVIYELFLMYMILSH